MTVVNIEVYREALRITDASQDEAIERTALRAEAHLTKYLGTSSLDMFYYEHGEQAYHQLEAALVEMVVRTFDDPSAAPITQQTRDWLSVYRAPAVG